jgi:autotransporter-associated beta strand protein
MNTCLKKPASLNLPALWILPLLCGLLIANHSAKAASATWLASPFNNNWIAALTTNNWSTGAGTSPGTNSGTSSPDIASFTNTSTLTTITNASAFVVGGILFDGPNASAYTIATSGGTWRVVGSGIRVTGTVVNKQTITGSLRMASSGTLNVVSDSSTPSATLNITTGISVNNSGSAGTLILGGTNTGLNVLGAFTEQAFTTAPGTLIKTNSGTWVVNGSCTNHGDTIIFGGTLILTGSGVIPNSPNIIVKGGTLSVSNTLTSANNMIITNAGALVLTNTFNRTPVTIGTLTASNATFHLSVNGATPFTNIVVTTGLTTGPSTAFAIDQVANLVTATTFNLISYVGTDPDSTSFSVTVPAGYTVGAVTVDTGNKLVQVTVTPPAAASSLVWVGATNAVLVSNWDTNSGTKNWVDAATLNFPQAYADPDTVSFNDAASNNIVTLNTTVTPFGVAFTNFVLNYTIGGAGKISGAFGLTKTGNASLTLAESGGDNFSGGVTVNGGTLILDNTNSAISGGLAVGSGATVQIGKNDANGALPLGSVNVDGSLIFSRSNSVLVSTALSGAGSVAQNGSGTLTLNNTNTYTGGTVVSKGVLALSGSGSISNSVSLLVSNATFDVSALATTTTLLSDFNITNAIINVGPTNLLAPIIANTFEADGIAARSNIINVLALPPIASYPSTITLIKSASPITLAGGTFNFARGSLPAGSPAYAGTLSESGDNTAVLLTLTAGPVGIRASVTWNATNNVSANTNWSDRVNWQLPGAPANVDNVFFDGNTTVANATTINNVVDTSFTNASLTYNQTASGRWHNTLIPAGSVLTVSGATGIGTGAAAGSTTSVTISGLGELDANGAFSLNNVGGASDSHVTLDMSGLSTFKNAAPASTMSIGTVAQQIVTVSLASNSIVNVATLNIEATGGSNGRTGNFNLGANTNTIYANNINVSTGKGTTTKIQFGANAPAGTVAIGGTGGGSARASLLLGFGNSGTAVCNGQLLLAGHLANVMAGTVSLGSVGGSTVSGDTGTVTFDHGTFDATSILMGSSTSAHSSSGTFTVGGDAGNTAVLAVGSGVVLGNASISAGTGAGTLNINVGGTANVTGGITKNTTAGAVNTATINLTDGTLNLVSGTVGTLAAPIDTLALSDSGASDTKIQLNVVVGVTNIVATTVSGSGVTTLNINSLIGVTGTTQIPLISYTGGTPFANLTLGTTPAGYTGASLVDSGSTIDLLITPPAPLIWKGAVAGTLNSSWDIGSTANWLNGASPSTYADVDFVQFDDTASTNVATLTTTISPAGLNISNNVPNYTFNGSGKLSGTVGLIKQGTGTLIVDNSGANDFTGGINIVDGALQIGNNDVNGSLPPGNIIDNGTLVFSRSDNLVATNPVSGSGNVSQVNTNTVTLAGINSYSGTTFISRGTLRLNNTNALGSWTGGAVTITNGGTLDIGGFSTAIAQASADFGAKQFIIAGAGVGGNGAIVNNGTNQQLGAFQTITLAANSSFGGPTRWDMRNGTPTLDLQGFKLTKTGTNQISLVAVSVSSGDIDINSGTLSFEAASAVNGTGTITVNSNATLGHFRLNSGAMTRPIVLKAGAIQNLATTGAGSINDSPITLKADSKLVGSTSPTNAVTLNGVISETGGSFGLSKSNAGAFILAANNTYSGSTIINGGALALTGSGSISNSVSIAVGAGATLDVSGLSVLPLVLNASQTLSGFGSVTGAVTTAGGSTVAPGSTSAVGVLSVSDLTLGGTNVMKLNRTSGATNDIVSATGALVLGGTLNVTLLGGSLHDGDTFTLFKSTGSLSGTFAVTNLPVVPGIGWVTTNLANGILSVVATVNTTPTNITTTVSGNVLTLSWPPDHTGWRLQSQTNSITSGLNTNWTDMPGTESVNSTNITMNPANGSVFYRMIYP